MRSLIAFLLLTFGLSFAGKSQVRWHVTAGPNYAKFTHVIINADDCKKFKLGFFVGGGAEIDLTPGIFLRSQFFYDRKGASYANYSSPTGDMILHYINLQPELGIRILKRGFVTAGPAFSYLIDANFYMPDQTLNLNANFRNFDVGITGGIGINISNRISIYGNYNRGLLELQNAARTYEPDGLPPYAGENRNYRLGLTYAFM